MAHEPNLTRHRLFLETVFLEYRHIHLFSLQMIYGFSHTTIAEVLQHSLCGPQGLKYLRSSPLWKKFANPWSI